MITIRLGRDCCRSPHCAPLAERTLAQLDTPRYSRGCSVLALPFEDAAHRTARKRAAAAERNGYTFVEIRREHHELDIFDINTSAPERQGRPMSETYRRRPDVSPLPEYTCPRHAIKTYGVLDARGHLRAYTWLHRVGDLAMFSTILGHADHLDRHVMYLLVRGTLASEAEAGPGYGWYNLHSSGTPGLRWFKERFGFRATNVRWEP